MWLFAASRPDSAAVRRVSAEPVHPDDYVKRVTVESGDNVSRMRSGVVHSLTVSLTHTLVLEINMRGDWLHE